MNLIVRILILSILIITCSDSILVGQCSFNQPKTILENGFFGVKAYVSGASNNNLSALGQGVCKVRLNFKHELVGDLRIRLISPSGQSIILVGPPVLASATNGNVWNIDFVRCGAPAAPDLGIQPTWRNNNLWGQNRNYTGTYHPPVGNCLESFNLGTVNGVWEIEVLDNYALSAGEFMGFSIEFCDNTGVSCNFCEASSGEIGSNSQETCAGDPALNLNIQPVYREIVPIPASFGYRYIIVNTNNYIVGVLNTPDLTNFSAGIYKIYGFSFANSDIGNLPIGNGSVLFSDFKLKFSGSNPVMCGDISDNFYTVQIRGATAQNPVIKSDTICIGNAYNVAGQSFNTSGDYILNLKTSNNCDSVVLLKLVVLDIQSIVVPPTQISCINSVITLNAIGSTGGANSRYSWSTENGFFVGGVPGPIIGSAIQVTGIGTYTVLVTLAGCTGTTNIEVTSDNSLPSIIGSDRNLDCTNPNNITMSVSTNATTPTFAWTGPGLITNPNSPNPIISTPGTYTLRVTSGACTISKKFIIRLDQAQPSLSINSNPYKCESDTVKLSVTSNVSSLNYSWKGPNGFASFIPNPINIGPGIYFVTITASNGCTNTGQINYTPNLPTPNISIQGKNIDCVLPSVDITASSLTPGVTYAWYFQGLNLTNNNILNAVGSPGDYYCIVTDNNNCKGIDTFSVRMDTIRPTLTVSGGLIACNQDSIRINAAFTPVNTSIFWSGNNFNSSGNYTDIFEKGTYRVTAVAQNGCSIYDDIVIDFSVNKPVVSILPDTLTCGKPALNLNPMTGANIATWAWTGPQSQSYSIRNPLISQPGSYRLKATASNGCHSIINTDIQEEIGFPFFKFSFDSINCVKDSMFFKLDTLESNAYFKWENPNGDSIKVQQFYTKIGGAYKLYLQGRNGCLVDTTLMAFTDTIRPGLNITSTGVGCIGTPSRMIVTGTIPLQSISWTNANGYLSNILAPNNITETGLYDIYLTGLNGCVDTLSFVEGFDTIRPIVDATGGYYKCVDPNFSLDVITNGIGAVFHWTGPNGFDENYKNPRPNGPGIFNLSVKFPNGCEVTDTALIIPFDSIPTMTLFSDTLTCAKTNLSLRITTSTNNLAYNWASTNFSAQTRNPQINTPGLYYLTITDQSNGCKVEKGINIAIDTIKPYFYLPLTYSLNCSNPLINLMPDTVYSPALYSWKYLNTEISTNPSYSVINAGIYSLDVSLSNGCTYSQSSSFSMDTIHPTASFIVDTLTCSKSKAEIIPSISMSDVALFWNGPNGFTSTDSIPLVLQIGLYNTTITAANGCQAKYSIEVLEDKFVPIVGSNGGTLRCDSRNLKLGVIGLPANSEINWYGPQNFFSADTAPVITLVGTYYVIITPPNGCQVVDTLLIDDNFILPQISIAQNGSLSCTQPSMKLARVTNSNIASFAWQGPGINNNTDSLLTITIPGTYQITVTDLNGCISFSSIIVPSDSLKPRFVFNPSNQIKCTSTNFQLSIDSLNLNFAYSFRWETANGGNAPGSLNQQTLYANSAGTYIVTVINNINGCRTVGSYDAVPVPNDMTLMDLDLKNPDCKSKNSGTLLFSSIHGGTAPYQYSLQGPGFYTNNNFFQFLRQGNYSLSVRDKDGCILDSIITMTQLADLNIQLIADKYDINLGDSVKIDLNINRDWAQLANYAFIPDSISCLPCSTFYVKPLKTTNYIFTALDTNGCVGSTRIKIYVNGKYELYVPNIFSPNGDGINDELIIGGDPSIKSIAFIEIYNRWGGLLYRKENFVLDGNTATWDGKYQGSFVPPAVYTYLIKIVQDDDYESTKAGTITTIR